MATIVAVRAGSPPAIEEIDGSLASMQAIVGGYIEVVHLGGGLSIVCNEDGISLGLPQNGCGMLGDFFFARHDDEGDLVSLTPADIDAVTIYATTHRGVRHPGTGGFEVRSYESWEEMLADMERRKFDADHAN